MYIIVYLQCLSCKGTYSTNYIPTIKPLPSFSWSFPSPLAGKNPLLWFSQLSWRVHNHRRLYRPPLVGLQPSAALSFYFHITNPVKCLQPPPNLHIIHIYRTLTLDHLFHLYNIPALVNCTSSSDILFGLLLLPGPPAPEAFPHLVLLPPQVPRLGLPSTRPPEAHLTACDVEQQLQH